MGGGAFGSQQQMTPGAATKDAEKRKYSEAVWRSYWDGASKGMRNERPASAMKEFGDGNGDTPSDDFYIRDDESKDAYRQRLEGLGFKSVWMDLNSVGDLPAAKPDAKAAPDLTDAMLRQKAAAEMDAQRMRRGRLSTFLGAGNTTASPTAKKTLLGG